MRVPGAIDGGGPNASGEEAGGAGASAGARAGIAPGGGGTLAMDDIDGRIAVGSVPVEAIRAVACGAGIAVACGGIDAAATSSAEVR